MRPAARRARRVPQPPQLAARIVRTRPAVRTRPVARRARRVPQPPQPAARIVRTRPVVQMRPRARRVRSVQPRPAPPVRVVRFPASLSAALPARPPSRILRRRHRSIRVPRNHDNRKARILEYGSPFRRRFHRGVVCSPGVDSASLRRVDVNESCLSAEFGRWTGRVERRPGADSQGFVQIRPGLPVIVLATAAENRTAPLNTEARLFYRAGLLPRGRS